MRKLTILLGAFAGLVFTVRAQNIYTIAGNGTLGFSGDGGIATAAELNGPTGIRIDGAGNIYIADYSNGRIRKVNASGVISTFAGNGTFGFSGDGGMATAAGFRDPGSIAIDGAGNVYIADIYNHRIRKINSSGIISTFAGNGTLGFSGDGGIATAAELNAPGSVTTDGAGNIYIGDFGNNRIREVNSSGIISTFAGNGTASFSGDGGMATAAELYGPWGIATDGTGNIFIADVTNERIREVNSSGIISTFAGNGTAGFSGDGGIATAAELYRPTGLAIDGAGIVYIADASNNRIRKVNSSGIISTFAGNGILGFSGDGGISTAAELNNPNGIGIDGAGNIYIADFGNNRIREVTTGSPFAINETIAASQDVTVYPNPANTILNVVLPQVEFQNICIYNTMGQKVKDIQSTNEHVLIPVSSLTQGVYFCRMTDMQGKLIKEDKVLILH